MVEPGASTSTHPAQAHLWDPLVRAVARRPALSGVLATALIGLIDYTTGRDLRVFPLYFIPVALVSLVGSRTYALLGSLLGTTAWALSNHDLNRPVLFLANVLSQAVAFVVVALLVSSQKKWTERYRTLALIDPLTGLLNARAFHERAKQELAAQKRSGRPLSVAYLDIDNFKMVNTRLGHLGADKLLETIGGVLKSTARLSDTVGRLGGDEFAILLPETDADAAREALLRVQQNVLAATSKDPVSFSIGAVSYPSAAANVAQMLKVADTLMYEVKNAGKNNVVVRSAASLPPPKDSVPPPSGGRVPPSSRR